MTALPLARTPGLDWLLTASTAANLGDGGPAPHPGADLGPLDTR